MFKLRVLPFERGLGIILNTLCIKRVSVLCFSRRPFDENVITFHPVSQFLKTLPCVFFFKCIEFVSPCLSFHPLNIYLELFLFYLQHETFLLREPETLMTDIWSFRGNWTVSM